MWPSVAGIATFFASVQLAAAQAPGEPPGNQILLGAWVDTSDAGGSDSPHKFNERIGANASVFQLTQDMPRPLHNADTGVGGEPPQYLIEQTQTDAAVFLTVYPTQLDIADDDWTVLTDQLQDYIENNQRTVFLRFAPEMQGTWNAAYGFQPLAFKALWAQMYSRVRQASPETIIVWAPNLGLGYPYSQAQPTNASELAELDTNGDGTIDINDDPYGPYYPGDDMVDWAGLSIYWKGPNYLNRNQGNPAGYCQMVLHGYDPFEDVDTGYDFYDTYCDGKQNIACMLAESGSAYHVDVDGGETQVVLQRAWWQDCMTNNTFYDNFPRLKMNMHFEYEKVEDDDLRDYRLTNDTAVVEAFSSELADFSTRVSWAGYRTLDADTPSTGVPSTAVPTETTSSCSQYCGEVSFTTDRNPETGSPNLFGSTRESSALQLQAGAAVGVTGIAMFSAAMWLSGRQQRNLQQSAFAAKQ